jgi:hypothetical protein
MSCLALFFWFFGVGVRWNGLPQPQPTLIRQRLPRNLPLAVGPTRQQFCSIFAQLQKSLWNQSWSAVVKGLLRGVIHTFCGWFGFGRHLEHPGQFSTEKDRRDRYPLSIAHIPCFAYLLLAAGRETFWGCGERVPFRSSHGGTA